MTSLSLRTDGAERILHERFDATAAGVVATLTELQAILELRTLPGAALADILLALGEILNNIVEHSVFDLPEAKIDLDVKRAGNRLLVETTDRGRPLPPSLLSSAKLPPITCNIDTLPEGGFGWFIIHSLAHDVAYQRDAGLNRLRFSFAIA